MATGTGSYEAELLVVGGGGAGLASAIAAGENGCKNITVIEKAATPAGSTSMAHDIFGAESPVQKRAGVDAPRDLLFKAAMEWAHWSKINPRLVRAFIDKSGDTIRWLEEKGLRFELIQFYPNQVPLVRHSVVGHGTELMKVLRKTCQDLGVRVLTRTRGKKLLHDDQGHVTGVVADTLDGEITVRSKGVIVTTGGYGNNKEMLKKYCAYYKENMTYDGLPSNTGDGIAMAVDAGVATDGLGVLNLHGPYVGSKQRKTFRVDAKGPDGNPVLMTLLYVAWEPETLWVNKHGRRFMDEAFDLAFFAQGNAVAQQPDGLVYTLFDSANLERMEKGGLIRPGAAARATWLPMEAYTPLPGLVEAVRAQTGEDLMMSDSWDTVAAWIGADPKTLKATIEEYNTAFDLGHDGLFAKDRRYLRPLRKAPFYAIRGHASICDALGGIQINEKMEALDTEGNVVPGLYAAGSTAGCWESESYCYRLTGHLVGFALNSGRIAGENAAAYVAR
ncbi:MAG: FAD-dependent oxidoreductase [Syntrophorhabdales bacterium]|jgi:fumarate reductase flavoprotein subunit